MDNKKAIQMINDMIEESKKSSLVDTISELKKYSEQIQNDKLEILKKANNLENSLSKNFEGGAAPNVTPGLSEMGLAKGKLIGKMKATFANMANKKGSLDKVDPKTHLMGTLIDKAEGGSAMPKPAAPKMPSTPKPAMPKMNAAPASIKPPSNNPPKLKMNEGVSKNCHPMAAKIINHLKSNMAKNDEKSSVMSKDAEKYIVESSDKPIKINEHRPGQTNKPSKE
jgi:hypothetical protein